MNKTHLHIVAFDVPYPANYGGAIDIFYKLKALKALNIDIHLHCFQYGREEAKELTALCHTVHYYPRQTGIGGLSLQWPYIVYSRRHKQLLQHLVAMDAPILFEGVHSCYYLHHPLLQHRFKAVRAHNIEHQYYQQLAAKPGSLLSKTFFKLESRLLHSFEHQLQAAQAIYTLTSADAQFFKGIYPQMEVQSIGPFHQYNAVVAELGLGQYALYQGNLQHPENVEAVHFLLQQVVSKVSMQVIIAGRKPSDALQQSIKQYPNVQLVADPTDAALAALVAQAQVHLLPTFQPTGMKLKLLRALFAGRHVVVNNAMIAGTQLGPAVTLANSPQEWVAAINRIAQVPFSENDLNNRIDNLKPYNNHLNAVHLAKAMGLDLGR